MTEPAADAPAALSAKLLFASDWADVTNPCGPAHPAMQAMAATPATSDPLPQRFASFMFASYAFKQRVALPLYNAPQPIAGLDPFAPQKDHAKIKNSRLLIRERREMVGESEALRNLQVDLARFDPAEAAGGAGGSCRGLEGFDLAFDPLILLLHLQKLAFDLIVGFAHIPRGEVRAGSPHTDPGEGEAGQWDADQRDQSAR
jgi:hypothetical protein